VVADAGLLAVGDDEVLGGGAVREEGCSDRLLEAFGGERLPVELEHVVDGLGGAKKLSWSGVFERRRALKSSRSTSSATPSARSRSASSSGNAGGTAACSTPISLHALAAISSIAASASRPPEMYSSSPSDSSGSTVIPSISLIRAASSERTTV
jgi:hypothetical protein